METQGDDAMIDRKAIREGDEVWVSHAGYYSGEPYAHVYGGVVVAVGADGGFIYRTAEGRVDTVAAWNHCGVNATEAEAWLAAGRELDRVGGRFCEIAAECRAKGVLS